MGDAREAGERMPRLWNGHDISGWTDLFADAELSGPGLKGSGAETARTFYSVWQDAFPDTQVRVRGLYEDGDTVIQEAIFEGTHTGTFNVPGRSPIEATNKKVSLPYTAIATVQNGKVQRFTLYFDRAELMSQLDVDG
jgi:predicted ester cyclase